MKELKVDALTDNLDDVIQFVEEQLDETGCSQEKKMQLRLAIEEVFVNIASYAYGDGKGEARIVTDIDPEGTILKITFIDSGIPFDPLQKGDPDTTLAIEKRPIGGLGIFLVKKLMDDVDYRYSDGHNELIMVKDIS